MDRDREIAKKQAEEVDECEGTRKKGNENKEEEEEEEEEVRNGRSCWLPVVRPGLSDSEPSSYRSRSFYPLVLFLVLQLCDAFVVAVVGRVLLSSSTSRSWLVLRPFHRESFTAT